MQIEYKGYKFKVFKANYLTNGNIAVVGLDNENDYITFSVNTDFVLGNDQFAVDTNNYIDNILREMKIAENTDIFIPSGFCTFPVMKLLVDLEELA